MKKILFVLAIASMGLIACVGGNQDSSSECTTETKKECCSSDEGKKECSSNEGKKECCSSKSDSAHSHDHGEDEGHNHDHADGEDHGHEH